MARRLARGHGWPRARAIMRAAHGGDVEGALALIDAGHAELDSERGQLAGVLAAFATVAAGTAAGRSVPRGGLRIGEAARRAGVRASALRVWESRGLLRPARDGQTGYRTYTAADLRDANVVALLRRGAYGLSTIAAVLDELRATGSPERVRAALASRQHDLTRRSLARLAASAAFHAYLTRPGGAGPATST